MDRVKLVGDMLRKEAKVKKYFTDHQETLEGLKVQLLQYSDTHFQLNDERIPDFQEFLARNKTIAEYYNKADVNEKRTSYHRPLYRRFGFVVPVTIVLLASCLLAFTTPGKALAASVYRTVVQWFDHSVDIQYGPGTTQTEYQNNELQYYDSLDEIRSQLHKQLAENTQSVLWNQIELEQHDATTIVTATYKLNSDEFVIIQTNAKGETTWNSGLQFGKGETLDITVGGVQYVGYVLNGHGYAIAYIDEMSIQIISDNIDYDRFVAFLKDMVIE